VTALRYIGLGEVQNLVAHSEGEWDHLEFKKTTGESHGRIEMPCAVSNGAGGNVLFGVTNVGRI
jgi:predicted HTH transcriptional regulator